jgi:hypothetical protein
MDERGPGATSVRLSRTCTIGQVKRIVCHHLHALWAEPSRARTLPPLMIWGPPGVGKSEVIYQVCAEEDIGFVDVRLAQREPVDIRGLPVPRDDGVHWLVSAEWPREGKGIIFFDELTASDRSLQVAAYEFILDRRLGDLYRVPDGWYLCAAGNRLEDRAVTLSMSSALANRFCHLEVEVDLEDWTRWAVSRGVHPTVVGFIRFQPQLLFSMQGNLQQGWPSPRTWERVGLELEQAEAVNLPEAELRVIVQGLVGPAAATEFFAYRSMANELPQVAAMLRGDVPLSIPARPDQRYALCTAAVHHVRRDPALLDGLLRLTLELSSDFAAMCLIDYLSCGGEAAVAGRAKEVFTRPLFEAWQKRHGPAFRTRFASVGADVDALPGD